MRCRAMAARVINQMEDAQASTSRERSDSRFEQRSPTRPRQRSAHLSLPRPRPCPPRRTRLRPTLLVVVADSALARAHGARDEWARLPSGG